MKTVDIEKAFLPQEEEALLVETKEWLRKCVRLQYSLYYVLEFSTLFVCAYLSLAYTLLPPLFQFFSLGDANDLHFWQYLVGTTCFIGWAITNICILLRPRDDTETIEGCHHPRILFAFRAVTYAVAIATILQHTNSFTEHEVGEAGLVTFLYTFLLYLSQLVWYASLHVEYPFESFVCASGLAICYVTLMILILMSICQVKRTEVIPFGTECVVSCMIHFFSLVEITIKRCFPQLFHGDSVHTYLFCQVIQHGWCMCSMGLYLFIWWKTLPIS